jgi:predicted amidohydrolase YtcJ
MRFAEMMLTGGSIHTGERSGRRVEAMAVADGRVVAVGRESELESLAGPGTRAVRLGGRCIVPGFIDSHVHLLGFGLALGRVDLRDAATMEEALSRIRDTEARTAPEEWVVAAGWDRHLWPHLPTRRDLDRAVSGRPALVWSRDGHVAWLNSTALHLSGVDRDTVNPPGGEVVRDPDSGDPTGLLLENAMKYVAAATPPLSAERCYGAVSQALEVAVSRGLTGVQSFDGRETLDALQQLRSRGQLPLRVCCHLPREGLEAALGLGLRTGFGDEWVRIGHLKLFLDGALGSQTAHMLEPYEGSESRGIATMERDELREVVLKAAAGGIAVAVHAIGDAANRVVLDVLEETRDAWGPPGLRPRVEHAQIVHPEDLGRFAAIGVIASMQPIHAVSDWPVAERLWGDRSATAYAWRSLLDTGAVLAFGSDCPVEPIDPLLGMHAAVTRQRADGEPTGGWYAEQRLRPMEALGAFTSGSAYSSGEEAVKGTLSPGKLADFVVLSIDPLQSEAHEAAFLSAEVEATVVGGRVVHGDL